MQKRWENLVTREDVNEKNITNMIVKRKHNIAMAKLMIILIITME